MAFTNDDYLPTYEELTVPEINLSSVALRAGAHHFGKYCDGVSKEFMLCDREEKDPRKCINEGKAVTMCAMEFFKKIKLSCAEEFTNYYNCIDMAKFNMHYKHCRTTQKAFDKCVLENFDGQERPPLGYFAKARVHHTERPKPIIATELPDALPEPPTWDGRSPAPPTVKQGNRWVGPY